MGWDRLIVPEGRVADLVATGLSNPDLEGGCSCRVAPCRPTSPMCSPRPGSRRESSWRPPWSTALDDPRPAPTSDHDSDGTKPADLKGAAASHDVIGERTDDVIMEVSGRSPVTLAAWGSHGSLLDRSAAVVSLLSQPTCLGETAGGQPRHPLYVLAGTDLPPYPAVEASE